MGGVPHTTGVGGGDLGVGRAGGPAEREGRGGGRGLRTAASNEPETKTFYHNERP